MIKNAKDTPLNLNPNTLPNMSEALDGWFQNMTFTKIEKSVVNFKNVEVKTSYTTKGVKQPMSAQSIQMKPEGQRAWIWVTIHCLPDLILNIDEIVFYMDVPYRVKSKMDYKEYGYLSYDLVEDYDGTCCG